MRNRQRVDLVADDPAREAERLVALGATRLADQSGHLELADPDGHEFGLRTA
ncbi:MULTISPECIES: VOC family protein [unclassified Brachybacterium]|uniref:VOC family protein n=1 Tax=unclassified Brachybacterium TaxID=2623841 RepID=UPI004033C71D